MEQRYIVQKSGKGYEVLDTHKGYEIVGLFMSKILAVFHARYLNNNK